MKEKKKNIMYLVATVVIGKETTQKGQGKQSERKKETTDYLAEDWVISVLLCFKKARNIGQ